MQKCSLLVYIFIGIYFCNCVMPSQDKNEKVIDAISYHKDTFHLLCQYWQLVDAEHPTLKDVSYTNSDSMLIQPGIVFMVDSSILENPAGEKTYGKFHLSSNKIEVNFEDKKKAIYTIRRLNKDELLLERIENKHSSELIFKPTNTFWAKADKNPFSKQNYQWSQKPVKLESDQEIRTRVKDFILFCKYYFEGFINGEALKIDFTGIPCCLNWYQGGITIQSEHKLDKKWMNCFFSRDQAYEARQILQDALTKKYDWNEKEANWLKQTTSVLQQIHDKM